MKLKNKLLIDYYLGGVLIILFKPIVIIAGKLLKRRHSLKPEGDIVFIKLLGGGSILIAMPALLGLRQQFPDKNLYLITTPSTLPFAKLIGIFDNIYVIDDHSTMTVIYTSFKVLSSLIFVDTVIDLEIYSRLSTIFSVLLCARNRIGFYRRDIFWRKNIQTHLVFFNPYAGIYHFYNACVEMMGAKSSRILACREYLLRQLPQIYSAEILSMVV